MAPLTEAELSLFVDSVRRYFDVTASEAPQITSAFLGGAALQSHAFTGTVQFSGSYRGQVLVSMPGPLLRELLRLQHATDLGDANLLDAVGEIANTLAGNARQRLGAGLQISLPVTRQGLAVVLPGVRQRPYAITLRWQHQPALVVVDMERLQT
ncbi:chemotaxis protein CheX [Rhodoferax sp.]|uniref:chemotaxis protein CheX n=1 Tax=Rhodoferax sp. TaxID=50421 RepID=UPI00374CE2C9